MLPNLNIGVYDADGSFKITDKKALAVLEALLAKNTLPDNASSETTLTSVLEQLITLTSSSDNGNITLNLKFENLEQLITDLNEKLNILIEKI